MGQNQPVKHKGHLLVVALLLALFAQAVGCASPSDRARTKRLAAAEVKQYKGQRLDSFTDMRENSIKGPQEVDLDSYRLKIDGEVGRELTLPYDRVIDRQTYEKVVRLNCIEGWSVDILWKGVLLKDLLGEANYDKTAKTVIFHCADDYTTSLPLSYIVDNDILLAYQMNGIDLPTERGFPFQVVAEDKYGYKWAKWVERIEISNQTDYEGYWEQRGYDNDADLPDSE